MSFVSIAFMAIGRFAVAQPITWHRCPAMCRAPNASRVRSAYSAQVMRCDAVHPLDLVRCVTGIGIELTSCVNSPEDVAFFSDQILRMRAVLRRPRHPGRQTEIRLLLAELARWRWCLTHRARV